MKNDSVGNKTNSLGHQLSHAAHLDAHFAMNQAEYEAMIRAVGIEKGWSVLDAGCGAGSFLPLLANLVGPQGKIAAIDIAEENVQFSTKLAKDLDLSCSVAIQKGELTQLPFNADTFDAVWCANVSQYLVDEQFGIAIEELIRVTKPGGLVAIKEYDLDTWQYQPTDPQLISRLFDQQHPKLSIQGKGALRSVQFRSWYHRAGLDNIRMKTYVSEIQPPVRPEDRTLIQGVLQWLADIAKETDLSKTDKLLWKELADIESDNHILNRPDFYGRESHILAVGTKPVRGR